LPGLLSSPGDFAKTEKPAAGAINIIARVSAVDRFIIIRISCFV
jgi:hypothetical protein